MNKSDHDIRVDFHCHTRYSKDSLNNIPYLLNMCRRRGVDRVVITDHNTIQGALIAQQLDPDRVIVGEEIKTTKGELLAVYVTEEVPAGLSPVETISLLRSQGAFISVSHPFDLGRSGHWDVDDLLEITPLIDAIEIFNRALHSCHLQYPCPGICPTAQLTRYGGLGCALPDGNR